MSSFITWLVIRVASCLMILGMGCTFHHLVGDTKVSSFITWLVIRVASCLMILGTGCTFPKLGWLMYECVKMYDVYVD